MLHITNTPDAPAAIGPYSQAISYGDILFTSGQIPLDPTTGEVTGDGIAAQTEVVMKNIGALLRVNNTDFTKVIKTTCFLADIADFAAFNEVYARYFTGKPARSCFAVRALPKNVLVEVECVAVLK